ncbi:hypothetical protein [Parvimonas parva]|uniref:Uncharacterized protein n=1 Tax=Parvimonas parva TaxID=2769485 RepID=A0ABS1C932_9FIRM|nr:hypothetical protein [Parvimonas parva]MBK1468453.1 hypothetical protein [Parvimonas parva]
MLKKFFQKIRIYGDVDYKTYKEYLKTLDIDKIKDLKLRYKHKIIQSNTIFTSIVFTLTISSIGWIIYKSINFIQDVLKNSLNLEKTLYNNLIFGTIGFAILSCVMIFFIVYLLFVRNSNKSKKLDIIEEFLEEYNYKNKNKNKNKNEKEKEI